MSNSRNFVTGLYVLAAIALSVAAYVVYPKPVSSGMEEQVNKPLFEFDPKSVRGLAIVKYDQERSRFDEIVMENSLVRGWQIPSKFDYPVDSAEKLISAASSLTGLVVLAVASEDPTDEETFGVIEPKPGLQPGQEGVGVKVTLTDKSKQEIAAIIVGKPVKDQPQNRFVRIPGQRFIYICEYDPSILKTDFFDWINPKILTLEVPWTVARVDLDRYVASKSGILEVQKSYQARLSLDDNQWSTRSFVDASDPEAKPNLNLAELERIRLAIENFEIQDVVRKSPGLAQSLKERKGIPVTFGVMNNIEPLGFFVDEEQDPQAELGAGGSLTFATDGGIQFRLLFGKLISGQATGKANDQRYVMVSAAVDEAAFPLPPKPKLSTDAPAEPGNDPPKPPGSGCDPLTMQDDDDREALRQYQIKLDEREQKMEAAKTIADQVNDRYADWFYLIDNQLYRRLMPAKESIVTN